MTFIILLLLSSLVVVVVGNIEPIKVLAIRHDNNNVSGDTSKKDSGSSDKGNNSGGSNSNNSNNPTTNTNTVDKHNTNNGGNVEQSKKSVTGNPLTVPKPPILTPTSPTTPTTSTTTPSSPPTTSPTTPTTPTHTTTTAMTSKPTNSSKPIPHPILSTPILHQPAQQHHHHSKAYIIKYNQGWALSCKDDMSNTLLKQTKPHTKAFLDGYKDARIGDGPCP